ncbi:MAG: DUF2225 domain-containing protein [Defluviitaleaceae bacterium]|nr:DUF2225 domain-containing protein [Defluviitaleaceae bacterium]
MTDNIFGGLEKFGLEGVLEEGIDIFETAPKKGSGSEKAADADVFSIDNYVYLKEFDCLVCRKKFESYVVKWSKVRLERVEYDLRPIYSPVNHLYYDVLCCPICGHAALSRVFDKITERQIEIVRAQLRPHYKHVEYPKEPTIEQVLDRYKLALLNATIKKAKQGEKAFLCTKITWLYRIKGDDLENEKKFATLAIRGFMKALEEEHTPIMGMEEITILYLMAALSSFLGNYKNALKILSTIIVSKKASQRLKDKSRDLRDFIKNQQIDIGENGVRLQQSVTI